MHWKNHSFLMAFLWLISVIPLEGQQIPQYSHYLLNGLLVNPAYAGYREIPYAQFFYHNQWTGPGTPQYLALAADDKITNAVNLGFIYSNERMGSIAINSFSAAYAYRIQLSPQADLSFGLSLGALYYSVNYGNLQPFEPIDPLLEGLSNQVKPNIDVGIYYGSDAFYAGLSARNITNTKQWDAYETSGYLIPLSTWNSVLTLGVSIPVTEKMEFRPSLMWQEDFSTPSHIDLTTAMLFLDRFWVGLSFRTDQHFWKPKEMGDVNELYSMAVIAEAFVTDRITVSYAYDFSLTASNAGYFGGHEVSVGYYFSRKIDDRFNRKYRYKKYALSSKCFFCP